MLDFDTKTVAIVGAVLGVGVAIGVAYYLMQETEPQKQETLSGTIPVPEEELPSTVVVVEDEDFKFDIRVTKGTEDIECTDDIDHLEVAERSDLRILVLHWTDTENVYLTVYFEDVIVSIIGPTDGDADAIINQIIDRVIVRLESLAKDFTPEDKKDLRGSIIALFSI